ncbi:MAG: hypothetical protein EA397_14155 [Deltaproteobacteria bacterium]|nr:MAG: hypothetical protein EA397_14155 [Deltaproteobacteria bacterium]
MNACRATAGLVGRPQPAPRRHRLRLGFFIFLSAAVHGAVFVAWLLDPKPPSPKDVPEALTYLEPLPAELEPGSVLSEAPADGATGVLQTDPQQPLPNAQDRRAGASRPEAPEPLVESPLDRDRDAPRLQAEPHRPETSTPQDPSADPTSPPEPEPAPAPPPDWTSYIAAAGRSQGVEQEPKTAVISTVDQDYQEQSQSDRLAPQAQAVPTTSPGAPHAFGQPVDRPRDGEEDGQPAARPSPTDGPATAPPVHGGGRASAQRARRASPASTAPPPPPPAEGAPSPARLAVTGASAPHDVPQRLLPLRELPSWWSPSTAMVAIAPEQRASPGAEETAPSAASRSAAPMVSRPEDRAAEPQAEPIEPSTEPQTVDPTEPQPEPADEPEPHEDTAQEGVEIPTEGVALLEDQDPRADADVAALAEAQTELPEATPTEDPVDPDQAALRFDLGLARRPDADQPSEAARPGAPTAPGLGTVSNQARHEALTRHHVARITTADTPLGRYRADLDEIIAANWLASDLPIHERSMGVQGDTTVIFRVKRNGKVQNKHLTQRSGFDALDQLAFDAIPDKLPKVPRELGMRFVYHRYIFHYRAQTSAERSDGAR